MLEHDPEDKTEFVERFTQIYRKALLSNKSEISSSKEYFTLETTAGEWELHSNFLSPAKKRYELRLNGGHMNYFSSIKEASKTISEVTYDGIFE